VAAAAATASGRPMVVVVRDAHRRPTQAAALASLAEARPDAVVVDMGWPVPAGDRPAAAAWVTTFGASRASGEAVARLLAGAHSPIPATEGRTPRG
jgi:beta-N-acetylhexosaminidase